MRLQGDQGKVYITMHIVSNNSTCIYNIMVEHIHRSTVAQNTVTNQCIVGNLVVYDGTKVFHYKTVQFPFFNQCLYNRTQ